jgi:GNAT superfamily N-acetyltransferase
MHDPKHISFAEKLDGWLRQRFDIDSSVTDLVSITLAGNLDCRHYISNKRALDLYLRLWPDVFMEGHGYWPANTLVIARMEFSETRAGHGRALLKFFVQQADVYGYDKIALEHTHDGDDIQGFAKKFGFENAWPKIELPHRNWIASVSRIAESLNQTVVLP